MILEFLAKISQNIRCFLIENSIHDFVQIISSPVLEDKSIELVTQAQKL